jgi:hypothetical protein
MAIKNIGLLGGFPGTGSPAFLAWGPTGFTGATGASGTSGATGASGAGPAFGGTTMNNIAVQIVFTGVVPSGVSVNLQGSLDGINFFNIGSAITTAGNSLTFFTGNPVCYVRLFSNFVFGVASAKMTGYIAGQ